ncbi:MAG: transglycosylase SLT domain-containing protein, partial [Methylococcales bacterium]|nr:transglycosylase SLT domain-containing protein [Methylococcales bacterium]
MLVVGCAETPKAPISYNDRSPVVFSQNNKQEQTPLKSNRLKTAEAHKNTVWERLLKLYALPEVSNERVERQLNWYLDHPAYIARIQQRAEPYLHLILDEIEANNIPGELALLPVVESAFIPDAYSKADASGLWQFIPGTGKLYGLEQNSWYDGRRDILDSTQAATAFLKDLGETFNGDWNLALASYNWGKGNVWKAMEKNENLSLPTDYWSLDVPRETADYVPRLLAIAKLIANADEYGIHLNNIPNKPYLEVVNIDSPLDLQKAAQLANMPLDKFMKLNPGFNRASTSPDGPHRLLVPVEKVASFKTSLEQLPIYERVDQTQFFREQEERARHEEE